MKLKTMKFETKNRTHASGRILAKCKKSGYAVTVKRNPYGSHNLCIVDIDANLEMVHGTDNAWRFMGSHMQLSSKKLADIYFYCDAHKFY